MPEEETPKSNITNRPT